MRLKPPRQKKAGKIRTTTERGLGWDWQKFRKHAFARHGRHCKRCWDKRGVMVEGVHLHHIVPREVDPSKRLDVLNVEPLCEDCHKAIHEVKQ